MTRSSPICASVTFIAKDLGEAKREDEVEQELERRDSLVLDVRLAHTQTLLRSVNARQRSCKSPPNRHRLAVKPTRA